MADAGIMQSALSSRCRTGTDSYPWRSRDGRRLIEVYRSRAALKSVSWRKPADWRTGHSGSGGGIRMVELFLSTAGKPLSSTTATTQV